MKSRDIGSYAATIMGAILGGFVGGVLVTWLDVYHARGSEWVGVSAISELIVNFLIGAAIGSILGAWGLLHACAYPAARQTARNMAISWIVLGIFFAINDTAGITLSLLLFFPICYFARAIAVDPPTRSPSDKPTAD
jgi:hypothetical protein